jgi:hypothetical protein
LGYRINEIKTGKTIPEEGRSPGGGEFVFHEKFEEILCGYADLVEDAVPWGKLIT